MAVPIRIAASMVFFVSSICAIAQDPTAPADADDESIKVLSPITVTGSRIKRIDIDPGLLGRYVGQYALTGGPIPGLVITVLKEEDCLFAEVPGMGKVELSPESPTEFFYLTYGALLKLTFTKDDEGHVTGFEADLNGQMHKARRIVP